MTTLIALNSIEKNARVAWLNDDNAYNVGTVYAVRGDQASVDFDAGFKLASVPCSKLIKMPDSTRKLTKDISKDQLYALLKKKG